MGKSVKRNAAALMALLFLLVIGQQDLRATNRLEMIWFDQLQSSFADFASVSSARTVIVAIDDNTLEEMGQWPWPRARLAELIRRIDEGGAKVIGIDAFFPEPDRFGPEQDAVLARAIADAHVVLGRFTDGGGLAGNGRVGSASRGLEVDWPGAARQVSGYDLPAIRQSGPVVQNLGVFEDAAEGHGLALLFRNDDGVVRQLPLIANALGVLEPSFALEVARLAADSNAARVRFTDTGAVTVEPIAGHRVALNQSGEIYLQYRSHSEMDVISAIDVINDAIAENALAGKIVLLGATATGLHDQVFSPLGETVPGVAVHALAVEQIMAGQTLSRPAWMGGLEAALFLVLGAVLMIVQQRLDPLKALVAFFGMELFLGTLSAFMFLWLGLVFQPMYCAVSLSIVYMVMLIAAQSRASG